eukprot:9750071-Ditylum_brightwellii.AAC.1
MACNGILTQHGRKSDGKTLQKNKTITATANIATSTTVEDIVPKRSSNTPLSDKKRHRNYILLQLTILVPYYTMTVTTLLIHVMFHMWVTLTRIKSSSTVLQKSKHRLKNMEIYSIGKT